MRSTGGCLLISFLLLAVPGWAQQAPPPTPQPTPTQDQQAVMLANQALAAAGGAAAITAVADYSATGNITYHWDQEVQGTVTIRGQSLSSLRIDSSLAAGVRSESVTNGQTTTKAEDGGISHLHRQAAMNPGRLLLPYSLLRIALNSPAFGLTYKGAVEIGGAQLQDLQVQRVFSASDRNPATVGYVTVHFFVDPLTFRVAMMQDQVGPNHTVRQIQYSSYKVVDGLLVPFSIDLNVSGQPAWSIQLTNISFNSGLQDADFQLQ